MHDPRDPTAQLSVGKVRAFEECSDLGSDATLQMLESVKCRFSKCRFIVLSSKNWWKIYSRWGSIERKINPKNLGSVFSLCCRAGIDAAFAKADFFFAGVPTIENIKLN